MPELPEVDDAARRLRAVIVGRTIVALRAWHPSQKRQLPLAARRRAVGQMVDRVERRGKHQLVHLASGAIIHVHFVMDGEWEFTPLVEPLPRFTRVSVELDSGVRIALTDPRALCRVGVYSADAPPRLRLGPDADTDDFTVAYFAASLARRRGPIKPALLDQALVAGVGNIYAAEALWRARIDPSAAAASLSAARVVALRDAVRAALADGVRRAERYRSGDREDRFHVYDREGEPCTHCGSRIKRLPQSGRSTYYCPRCQRR